VKALGREEVEGPPEPLGRERPGREIGQSIMVGMKNIDTTSEHIDRIVLPPSQNIRCLRIS
jgi:hypothetical protein